MSKPKRIFWTFLASFLVLPLVACGESVDSSKGSSSSTKASSEVSSEASSSISESSSVNESSSSAGSESTSSDEVTTFHVKFVNDDDTLLYETDVEEGGEAVYVGDTPTKAEDDEFTYAFSGWDHELTNVQESFTTKAVYTSEPKEPWSSITWF